MPYGARATAEPTSRSTATKIVFIHKQVDVVSQHKEREQRRQQRESCLIADGATSEAMRAYQTKDTYVIMSLVAVLSSVSFVRTEQFLP